MTAKRTASRRTPRRKRPRVELVHQFLVVLANTDPLVWRRIEVPDGYSFWGLHVAIQDAMGWLDYHLHEFSVLHPSTGRVQRIGIPDQDDLDDRPLLADWQVQITEYFTEGGPPALYVYDFGDDWRHLLAYEGASTLEASVTYPRCLAGARACPPEDCGGVHGYAEFLAAVANPKHPEHAELLAWAGGHFDPDTFDRAAVSFDDPEDRWKRAFEE